MECSAGGSGGFGGKSIHAGMDGDGSEFRLDIVSNIFRESYTYYLCRDTHMPIWIFICLLRFSDSVTVPGIGRSRIRLGLVRCLQIPYRDTIEGKKKR